MNLSRKTKEIIHHRAESYFESVLKAINTAEISIDFESYIFAPGDISTKVSTALIQAAQRGVRVRLIVDGAGIEDGFADVVKSLRNAGVKVRIYHPLPWHLKYWPLAVNISTGIKKFWYLISSINKRNHRKTIIIDKRKVWLGSFNVSQKHFQHENGGENWRDTGIELNNADTQEISKAFNRTWTRWRHFPKRLKPSINSPFVLNHTRRLRKLNRESLLTKLERATHRIWITNAYFVPDAKLIQQLTQASERNIEVRILVPHHSDVTFIPWITRNFYQELLNAGIRIFEYQPGMLHSKTLIIDDWATVGSSNFNRRSLFHDLEVDYVIQKQESLRELEGAFIEDLNVSTEQTIESISEQYPMWQRFIGGVLLVLLGYWV